MPNRNETVTYLCDEGAFCAQTFGPARVRCMGRPAVGTEENTKLLLLNEFLFTYSFLLASYVKYLSKHCIHQAIHLGRTGRLHLPDAPHLEEAKSDFLFPTPSVRRGVHLPSH